MYNIAICDDDINFIGYLKSIIEKANEDKNRMLNIYEFVSGEDFEESFEKGISYDLLILDMQLGGMDGNEVARLYRKKFPEAVLAFCSGVRLPTIESFVATPFRYLLKSQNDSEFVRIMKEILAEVDKTMEEPYIVGHYRKSTIKLKLNNILYIENSKRGGRVKVCPGCKGAEFGDNILVDKRLEDIAEELSKYGFAFAHSSYLVNVYHVDIIRTNEFVMDTGEILSMSRIYQKNFKDVFARFVADKYL